MVERHSEFLRGEKGLLSDCDGKRTYLYLIEDSFICKAFFIGIEFFFCHCIAVDLVAINKVTVTVVVVVHGQTTFCRRSADTDRKEARLKQNLVTETID